MRTTKIDLNSQYFIDAKERLILGMIQKVLNQKSFEHKPPIDKMKRKKPKRSRFWKIK